MIGPIRLGSLDEAGRDPEVVRGPRDRAVMGTDDLDDFPDAEAGPDKPGTSTGGAVDEVDRRVIDPPKALIDEPLRQGRVRLAGLSRTTLETRGRVREEAKRTVNATPA